MSERDETLTRPGVDEPDVVVTHDGSATEDSPVLLGRDEDPVVDVDDTGAVTTVSTTAAEPHSDEPDSDEPDTSAPVAEEPVTEEPVVAEPEGAAEPDVPEPADLPALPDPGPWADLQGRFVDDPAGCVQEASELVDQAIQSLRDSLPGTGSAGGDTESLRQAFRRYRAVHEALTRA
ncbi:hypothetical protein ACIB24_20455 [Spongisporangium articulatum]|uniref:Uncharacterized protein n=1 Tax=Spongisporangium articulatum TaxID=3362603 RepID=A0ABW8ATN2_9ACTN